MTNSFNIVNGENYILDDVRAHQKAGGSVIRSAHIGNFDTVTLFLALQGFPILLHEHIAGNSKIYEPGYIKIKSKLFPLVTKTDLPLIHLSNIAVDINGAKKGRKIIKDFKNPAHFHYFSLLKLFPDNIKLVSESFLNQEDFFQKALYILAEQFPFSFTQYIREDGTVFRLLGQKISDANQIYASYSGERIVIEKRQIAKFVSEYLRATIRVSRGENIKPRGIVMSVTLYVLLSTICEVYKNRRGEQRYKKNGVTVMHFSGAAMIDYLILKKEEALSNSQKIEKMYQILLKEMPDVLPKKINFILIPTRVFKNFLLKSKKDSKNLERLFLNYGQLIERTKGLNKRQSEEYFEKMRKIICKDVRLINMPQEISQYDLLNKSCKIYAPDSLFYKSYKYLRKMINTLIGKCIR